jgi:hypothetical protein
MNRFSDILTTTASRLTVPEPAHSRILLELAADMEDLFRAYVEKGHLEDEARAAVREHFDLSDEALRELARVHDTPIQGILNGLSSHAQSNWERLVLAVLVVGASLLLGRVVLQEGVIGASSVFVWPVVITALVALGFGVATGRRLFLGADSGLRTPSRGIGRILGLAVLQVFLGMVGIWVELYGGALAIQEAPREALVHLVGWLETASATMTITLGLALGTALLWFLLAGQARRIERRLAAQLVEP